MRITGVESGQDRHIHMSKMTQSFYYAEKGYALSWSSRTTHDASPDHVSLIALIHGLTGVLSKPVPHCWSTEATLAALQFIFFFFFLLFFQSLARCGQQRFIWLWSKGRGFRYCPVMNLMTSAALSDSPSSTSSLSLAFLFSQLSFINSK